MIHLRSALRLMAMDSLLVICRLAPSMWPSSRITRSQCTYMPEIQVWLSKRDFTSSSCRA